MNYTNGIGNLQQTLESIGATAIKPTAATNVKGDETKNPAVERTDKADLSTASSVVAQALEASDVRSAKVASLQEAIASGSYNVPSSDVANKMIQSLLS